MKTDLNNVTEPVIRTEIPGPRAQALLETERRYVPRGIFLTVPTFIKRGSGAVLEDVDGNVFIDFAGGIGTLNIGYSHPAVVAQVKEQADRYFHSSINVVLYESYIMLAKRLSEIAPGDDEKKTMFANSGAEAVENAVKIARKFTGRTDVICFEGGFHGRTLLGMALTSKVKPYTQGFGPFPPGIHKIPYAYCYRCAYGLERDSCGLRCAERLEEIFDTVVASDDVAAVIVEPVQGESGFILPPDEFINRIGEICAEKGILLIADEIQTGFCRTGKMFASEYWETVPDIILTAKSLGGGLPLSAVTARAEIYEATQVGGIGGTYCGNPIACTAALKVIEIMEKQNYAERSRKIGKMVLDRFRGLMEEYEVVGDVRGRGAMVALELVKNRVSREPAKRETQQIVEEAYKHGLVLLSAGIHGNIIRTLMPLVITEEQLQAGLSIIDAAVGGVA